MRFPFWLAALFSGLNAALYVEYDSSTTLGIAVFFGLLAVAPAAERAEELEQAEIDPRLAGVMILVGFLICAAAVVTLLR